MLPFQMIYTDKTSPSLPTAKFSEGFLLRFNKSHWSNEEKTLHLLREVISPYINKVKKKLKLPWNQVVCLSWDSFTAQSTEKIKLNLEHLNIKDVEVLKNITQLPQPLDLTTNRVVKKMEQCKFSSYFINWIAEALLADPKWDVTTIKVDLKSSPSKPIHPKMVRKYTSIWNVIKTNKSYWTDFQRQI